MNPLSVYAPYRKWIKERPTEKEGIIVAADLTQEWLLPWWWDHYSRFNSYPVAFVDLGMSEETKTWCRQHGKLIPLPIPDIFVAEKAEMDPILVLSMENACGDTFWPSRNAWFKKPLACLKSPFEYSIWIDLDCEIRGCLNALYPLCEHGIAMAEDQAAFASESICYNTGVIVFKYGTALIEEWAEQSFTNNHRFRGDQDVLNELIQKQQLAIQELPLIYNWSRMNEENPQAIILHWHGPQGKLTISHHIARKHLKSWETPLLDML